MMLRALLLLPLLIACLAAQEGRIPIDPVQREAYVQQQAFQDYWYHRGAEITRYALQQSRYGDVRQGDAVLIFVTEPFSLDEQVKSDDPRAIDAVPVLKLNHTRHFLTGMYPYQVMSSGFLGLERQAPTRLFKHTTSVQEWCGHVFEQWNQQPDAWRYRLFSYFQSEGDQDRSIADAALEDGLWLRLRRDPTAIEVGETQLIPGAISRRFQHRQAQPQRAAISFTDGEQVGTRVLQVRYPKLDRELQITFRASMPWTIEAWRERDGNAVTTAVKTHRIMDPYWQHNAPADVQLRTQLGLPSRP